MPRKKHIIQTLKRQTANIAGHIGATIHALLEELGRHDGRSKKASAIRLEIAELVAEHQAELDKKVATQRQREADIAERDAVAAGVLAARGGTPNQLDKIAANNIASLSIGAERLERAGREAEAREVRRLLLQATRAFGVRPAPASVKPAKASDWDSYLAGPAGEVTP